MKKTIFYAALLGAAITGFSSCKKAGTGGDAILVVKLKHHGVIIPNQANYKDSVFIKFNTEELPSNPTTNYDMLVVGEGVEDHVHVEGLKTGKYFIYCTGWDTSINARVMGGQSVKIKYKERKEEIDTDIAVVE